ncbi:MAG: phytanoyl-CoA dioxygenase family protein [Planctomycetota bacterium JB042]
MTTVHDRTAIRPSVAAGTDDLILDEAPRATLAAVQLPTDLTLDAEGPALMARLPGVRLRLQKVALDGETLDPATYSTGAGRIARAAATLRPAGSVDALGLACTSLAFALGRDRVREELLSAHADAAVTDMATAVLAALEHVGARRVALLTPYLDELHRMNLDLLAGEGVEVVSHANLGLATDREITAIAPASIRDRALAVDREDADAVVLGCSAFRACAPGFLDALEERLGKPVIGSQQAFLWHLLRLAGVDDRVGGYGRLFSREPVARSRPATVAVRSAASAPDLYPSRVEAPGLVDRQDPVVDGARRYDGPLDEARLDRFDRRGVVTLRQVFSPEEVAWLKENVDRLRREYEGMTYDELDQKTDMRVITERGGSLVSGDEESPTLKSIWQIHLPAEHAPHMRFAAELSRRTVCDSRLVDAARQILGEEVYVHQSRINYQAGWNERNQGGSGFLWHQDFEQWHCEDGMPRMRAVSMAVLLERAVPANGALMVMPGSHRKLVQAYGDPDEADRYTQGALSRGPTMPAALLREAADRHGIEHCRGEPGDVVLFDCNTIHGSHTNISPWGRCMFFAVYNAVSNVPAERPYAAPSPRPEHIGSHDPRWAGVPLPSLAQALTRP